MTKKSYFYNPISFLGLTILLGILVLSFLSKKDENPKNLVRSIATAGTGSLKCPEFFKSMREQKPDSIDKTLKMVQEMRPKFLESSTFGYNSKSLHESSFANPRALVFGSDAKMVLSFNGNQSQKGYERLEIMCFNDQHKTFEFKEVTFPKEAKDDDQIKDIHPSLRNSNFLINERPAGQRDCKACHGDPPVGIWHPYSVWPGFCGSDDDASNELHHFGYVSKESRTSRNFKDKTNKEARGCINFFKGNFNKGRYKYLPLAAPKGMDSPPNARLGELLEKLNSERILAELGRKKAAFTDLKYQFAEILVCSDPIDRTRLYGDIGYLPKKPFDPLAIKIFKSMIENRAYRLSLVEDSLGKNNVDFGLGAPEPVIRQLTNFYGVQANDDKQKNAFLLNIGQYHQAFQMAQFHRLLAPLGVNIKKWALAPGGGYTFFTGGGSIDETDFNFHNELNFMQKFLPREAELNRLALLRDTSDYGQKGYSEPTDEERASARKKMCDIIRPKAAREKANYRPISPKQNQRVRGRADR